MNLVRCSRDHFYDSDTFASCPFCNGVSADNKTVSYSSVTDRGGNTTVDLDKYTERPDGGVTMDLDTVTTTRDRQAEVPVMTPIVGWLVCTKGKFYGQDFRLKSGRNFIGRSADMDICLTGEKTVSRGRHATVIHEPRKNVFIAQPGEARELFYVNGEVVLSSVVLKKNDVIQIGDVQLMLIPCCDEAFHWNAQEE